MCNRLMPSVNPCQQLRLTILSKQGKLEVKLVGAQRAMQVALSNGKGFAISDGSFKDKAGTAVWIIKDRNANLQIIRQGHTPRQPSNHSSLWSEMAGILGVLYTLTFWPPTTAQPTFI